MNPVRNLRLGLLALALVAHFGYAQAQAAFVGSWELDVASSTAPAGMAASAGTIEIADVGDGKYRSVSEATVNGATGRSEVTFAIDGKEYVVTSTPEPPGAPSVTQAVERVSDTLYKLTVKVNGEPFATALTEVSADGNTLTQTTTGVGQFAALTSKTVFRRK
jgi:hypothetical protein